MLLTCWLRFNQVGLAQGAHPLSSRAQARTTLGWEFPISALSIAKRVPSPTMAHVSCTLSKIPYSGFSPVRLQAEASCDQPYPARWPHGLKRQVRILPCDSRFDSAFVVLIPSCHNGGYYQPTSLGRMHHHLTPRVLGSARVVLSLPSMLLRPDPPVLTAPADFPETLVILPVCARRPDLGCLRDLPCFTATLLPYVLRSIRRQERWVPISSTSPPPGAFPSFPVGRLLHSSQQRWRLGVVTTLQDSLYATARMVARLPGSFRPDAAASAAEDLYARACPRGDHSPPESGMTTPPYWMQTVTGLTPAGALPLQAARRVEHRRARL